MNYTFMPSLEHRALVGIAITLWNRDDARDLASEWLEVGGEVIKKVVTLPLPELLKKKLSRFVVGVGWEILIWRDYHKNLFGTCSFRENLSELCWTPQGSVDMKKTAEILVGNESLDITIRYKLACTFCLEDHIYTLWEQLNGSELYGKDLRFIEMHRPPLASFWSCYVKEKIAQTGNSMTTYCGSYDITPYEYAFRFSAESGNKVATRYFLQKLSPEEKERILVTIARVVVMKCAFPSDGPLFHRDFPSEHYTDVLCLLLSAMNKEQQMKVFKSSPYKVLKCFLDWPWQSIFMEVAKHMWTFLTEKVYVCLLWCIVDKVKAGCKDYNYMELFVEFWKQSPTVHKIYIIDECVWNSPLAELFRITDKRNLELILKYATLAQRKKLILCHKGQDLFCGDDWDLLQFFIRECISSKNEMIEFKEEFKERITLDFAKEYYVESKDKLDKFFQLLDDFIENNDKRKLTEDDHPVKKVCNIECEKVIHSMEK